MGRVSWRHPTGGSILWRFKLIWWKQTKTEEISCFSKSTMTMTQSQHIEADVAMVMRRQALPEVGSSSSHVVLFWKHTRCKIGGFRKSCFMVSENSWGQAMWGSAGVVLGRPWETIVLSNKKVNYDTGDHILTYIIEVTGWGQIKPPERTSSPLQQPKAQQSLPIPPLNLGESARWAGLETQYSCGQKISGWCQQILWLELLRSHCQCLPPFMD